MANLVNLLNAAISASLGLESFLTALILEESHKANR